MVDFDMMKSRMFFRGKQKLLIEGWQKGLIKPYSDEFIRRARNVYYGGLPASILLLALDKCNHRCYDRAVLAACCMEDYDYAIYHAHIDSIRLHPKTINEVNEANRQGLEVNPNYPNHCFLVFSEGGQEWVLDTTHGLIIQKDLYLKMENPVFTKICSKELTMAFPDYVDIKNADFNKDKYMLPSFLPMYEATICVGPYHERLKLELEIFKLSIDYDGLCQEVEADKRAKGIIK